MNRCVCCGHETGHEEGCPNAPAYRKRRIEQEREIEQQKAPELLESARAALYKIAHDRFEPIIGEAGDLTVEDQLRAVARAELRGLATPQQEQVEDDGWPAEIELVIDVCDDPPRPFLPRDILDPEGAWRECDEYRTRIYVPAPTEHSYGGEGT